MPELMFVLKSLAIAVILTICLQVKIGSTSLEGQAYHWMKTSPIPQFLGEASSGAVMVIRKGAESATDFVAQTFGHQSSVQKAGRLNFEFKRSPQYQKEQSNSEQE